MRDAYNAAGRLECGLRDIVRKSILRTSRATLLVLFGVAAVAGLILGAVYAALIPNHAPLLLFACGLPVVVTFACALVSALIRERWFVPAGLLLFNGLGCAGVIVVSFVYQGPPRLAVRAVDLGTLLVMTLVQILVADVSRVRMLRLIGPARKGPGRCARCGYNLTGNISGRCPECGMPTTGPTNGRAPP